MAVNTRRARGLETEYGFQVRVRSASGAWRRLGSDEAAQQLFAPVVGAHAASNVYLRNGGRLYLDVGSHPEYATAECGSLRDLVAHDRAGDLVLERLAARLVETLAEQGSPARASVFKNNVDSFGNSWGSHENYQVDRGLAGDQGVDALARQLSGFLVTRQLVCGAGHWQRDRLGRGHFVVSQRAAHMGDAAGSATTHSRPLVNSRDEPHDDPARHRRLHVIAGDSTLIEACTLVRLGSTELVLRALEDGHDLAGWAVADTSGAIRRVADDVTGRTPVMVARGEMAGVQVQRELWRLVADYADDDELRQAHVWWGEVLDALESGRPADAAHLVDWIAKRELLLAELDRHGLAPDHPRLAQLDLAWHELTERGLFRLLQRRGRVQRWLAADEAERAVESPPATRAALRSRLVQAAQANHREHTVDWMRFTCHDLADAQLVLTDPLRAEDPAVDLLCRRMATEPRRASSSRFATGTLG